MPHSNSSNHATFFGYLNSIGLYLSSSAAQVLGICKGFTTRMENLFELRVVAAHKAVTDVPPADKTHPRLTHETNLQCSSKETSPLSLKTLPQELIKGLRGSSRAQEFPFSASRANFQTL